MGITQRFFSTAGHGAADGTTWDDRAQLINAGTWSSVITGFDFVGGGNSLQCFIGPGTYTCTTSFASGLFSNAPTIANQLFFCGCDSSGVLLTSPDESWLSAQPAFDASTFPVIDATTNIATMALANTVMMFLKFTSSGRNGAVITGGSAMRWCVVNQNTNNTAAIALGAALRSVNCVFTCSQAAYDSVVSVTPAVLPTLFNTRVEGVTGSSGNRRGVTVAGNTFAAELTTVVNNGAEGLIFTGTGTGQKIVLHRCTVANNGATGVKANSTAAQTDMYECHGCMITGNGTAGIDGNSGARWMVAHNRLRDNTTDITGLLNFPTDLNNYTTDSDDTTEYVSTGANGDFSIKATATAIWNKGYGARSQPLAGAHRSTMPSGLSALG